MSAVQGPLVDLGCNLPSRFSSKASVYLFKVRSMHKWAHRWAHEYIPNFMRSFLSFVPLRTYPRSKVSSSFLILRLEHWRFSVPTLLCMSHNKRWREKGGKKQRDFFYSLKTPHPHRPEGEGISLEVLLSSLCIVLRCVLPLDIGWEI